MIGPHKLGPTVHPGFALQVVVKDKNLGPPISCPCSYRPLIKLLISRSFISVFQSKLRVVLYAVHHLLNYALEQLGRVYQPQTLPDDVDPQEGSRQGSDICHSRDQYDLEEPILHHVVKGLHIG